jgi:hypothetical protein
LTVRGPYPVHRLDPPSFSERDFQAEPHRPQKSGHNHSDRGFEGETLSLLNAPAPPSQVLEIGSKFAPIILVYAERREGCRNSPQYNGIDFISIELLLFGECLENNRLDILILKTIHRFMILATFSKVRLPK